MTVTLTPSNPAAVAARAARFAERIARQQRIAEQRAAEAAEAAESAEQAPAEHWDTPVPFVPTEAAESALSAPSADEQDDWRAVLAPAPALTITPAALHALAATVKGVAAANDVPVLEYARLTLGNETMSIIATDRYRVHALTLPAEGDPAPVDAYVTGADLAAVARALAPAAARRGNRGTLPTISVTVDTDERTITWEAPDAVHVTTWEQDMNYPPVEKFLKADSARVDAPMWHVNPKYMGAAMTAAAAIAEQNTPARVTADAPAHSDQMPMIRVTAGDPASPAGVFDACIMSVRW